MPRELSTSCATSCNIDTVFFDSLYKTRCLRLESVGPMQVRYRTTTTLELSCVRSLEE